jgi:hypothetical protein
VTDPFGVSLDRYEASPRSRGVALVLAGLLGCFGAHRFYAGRTATAVAQLCTLGGLGLWMIYDVIMIAGGEFRDEEGRRLTHWDPTESESLTSPMLAEFERMRAELDEMHERLDFAERMLAAPKSGATEERP